MGSCDPILKIEQKNFQYIFPQLWALKNLLGEHSLPIIKYVTPFLGEYLISEWRPDLILKVLSDLHPNNLRQGHGQPFFRAVSLLLPAYLITL
jgi:hypothetical protein